MIVRRNGGGSVVRDHAKNSARIAMHYYVKRIVDIEENINEL